MAYEIVGAELDDALMGDDDIGAYDIVGARRRGFRGVRGRAVTRSAPSQLFDYICPFPSTGSVAAGASVTITAQPQRPFRLERIGIPAAAVANFVLTALNVGAESQFVNAGEVDAFFFAPGAQGAYRLKGNTVSPGMTISMTLVNITAGALTLRGIIAVGPALA